MNVDEVYIVVGSEGSEGSGTWQWNVEAFLLRSEAEALLSILTDCITDVNSGKLTRETGLLMLLQYDGKIETVYQWNAIGYEIETMRLK